MDTIQMTQILLLLYNAFDSSDSKRATRRRLVDLLLDSPLLRALWLVLNDARPSPDLVNVLFFHARANGDEDQLFDLAAKLYRQNMVKIIAINGSDGRKHGGTKPREANAGGETYKPALLNLG